MDTNELINILAQSPATKSPPRPGLLAFVVAILSALVTVLVLGLRPELLAWQPPLSFWLKSIVLTGAAVLSLQRLSAASGPLRRAVPRWPLAALAMLAVILVAHEWLTTGWREILAAIPTRYFFACVFSVSVYGGLGMAAFALLLRRYAPADIERCAGLAGLAAGTAAAVGYSIHCAHDSPSYVVVAYGLPILALWAVGRMVLPSRLNW